MIFLLLYSIILKVIDFQGDEDRACAIGNREPCQMGNQAAISGPFDVLWIYSVGAVFFIIWKLRFCNTEEYREVYFCGISGDLQKVASSCV